MTYISRDSSLIDEQVNLLKLKVASLTNENAKTTHSILFVIAWALPNGQIMNDVISLVQPKHIPNILKSLNDWYLSIRNIENKN